jgi:hypothetical protein
MVQLAGQYAQIAAHRWLYSSDPRLPEVHTNGATAEGWGARIFVRCVPIVLKKLALAAKWVR